MKMTHYSSVLLLSLLLLGCPTTKPAPQSGPVTLNRGTGVEAVTSASVLYIPVMERRPVKGPHVRASAGYLVQQTLVKWLKENPEADIKHMAVVGYSGSASEIVLIVEGELKKPVEPCQSCSSDCAKCGRNLRKKP